MAETKARRVWMYTASLCRIRFKSQMTVTNDKAVSTHMRSFQAWAAWLTSAPLDLTSKDMPHKEQMPVKSNDRQIKMYLSFGRRGCILNNNKVNSWIRIYNPFVFPTQGNATKLRRDKSRRYASNANHLTATHGGIIIICLLAGMMIHL